MHGKLLHALKRNAQRTRRDGRGRRVMTHGGLRFCRQRAARWQRAPFRHYVTSCTLLRGASGVVGHGGPKNRLNGLSFARRDVSAVVFGAFGYEIPK